MGNESSYLPSSLLAAYGLDKSFPSSFMPGASAFRQMPGNALFEYLTDAYQRTFLFLDILRQRGDQQAVMTSQPNATVLRFKHEEIMSGRALARPINYSLARIVPPEGTATDPKKRPVVVVDPRAGQGPGIGGFKKDSEIGDALVAGHPVYFIHFSAEPVEGQRFLDVVEGQVKFFEKIAELHPDVPKPMAVGNCQAGYQTLMVAMLRPDLFGPCLIPGSPMSYWQGVHGKNPMRYTGGLLGGSWLTALTSDLSAGKFDGTWLIYNFDNLNPANFLWGKQYDVYTHADTDGPRYLEFEKWWGDFIQLNGGELQWLVDELFVGDKLTRNELTSSTGQVFDLRNITSPIICLTSFGDNISPVQQTLGWILDLYRDVEDIRTRKRTIVYCIDPKAGHLAIFVSTRVGATEDEEFVQLIDVIDCLAPGLYEMVMTPKHDGPVEKPTLKDYDVKFETRTLDDIRALGRNSPDDDHAFEAVKHLSELTHNLYKTFWQPYVRAIANPAMADFARKLNPLRLSYTMFTSQNPFMQHVAKTAEDVRKARQPVSPSNPYWQAQEGVSKQIEDALNAYSQARDTIAEKMFFAIYGSPAVQAWLNVNRDEPARHLPPTSYEQVVAQEKAKQAIAGKLKAGGFDEALVRSILYITASAGGLDVKAALKLDETRKQLMHLSLADFKALVSTQADVWQTYREKSIEVLPELVPVEAKKREALQAVGAILAAAGSGSTAEKACLDRLAQILGAGAVAQVTSITPPPRSIASQPAAQEVHSPERS